MLKTYSILLFFFIYACFFGQNIPKAALVDFIIISKPFLLFYICYYLPINFNKKFKKRLQIFCIAICFMCLFIGINTATIRYFFGAEAQMASTISIATILYLYCSDKTSKDIKYQFYFFPLDFFLLEVSFTVSISHSCLSSF